LINPLHTVLGIRFGYDIDAQISTTKTYVLSTSTRQDQTPLNTGPPGSTKNFPYNRFPTGTIKGKKPRMEGNAVLEEGKRKLIWKAMP